MFISPWVQCPQVQKNIGIRDVILKKERCPTVTISYFSGISQLVGIIRHVKMPINNPNAHEASTSRGQHMVHHGPSK